MRFLALIAIIAVVSLSGSLVFCNMKAGGGLAQEFAAVPTEVQKGGKDFAGEDTDDTTVAAFSEFSWRSFIALNWPATEWPTKPQRGVADTARDFSDAKGPRVWETWKSNYEIIPKQPATGATVSPKLWNIVDDPTPVGGTTQMLQKVLGSNTRYGDISQAMMVFVIQTGQKGPLGSPLVCQNNTYTHFEVRMNRAEFSTIRGEGFYLRNVIDTHMAESGDDAGTKRIPFEFPHGSITVKAAWRELLPEDDASIFYTTKAKVLDYKTGAAVDRTLGLVGLHIVQKTPLRAQWVWSSFEHATNVKGLVTTAAKFSYNDGITAALSDPPPPVGSIMPPNPYVSPTPDVQLKPAQVVRNSVIHPQSAAANQKFHAMLPADSIWKNYHLVLTQWPTKPTAQAVGDVLEGRPFPTEPLGNTSFTVSNMTMETWTQGVSCIACHETAEKAGFDYVFFPAMHAELAPGTTLPAGSRSLKFSDALQKKLQSASDRSKKLLDK